MRHLIKAKFQLLQAQTGFTFIETVIALGILGLIGVTFMNSVNTMHRNVGVLDEHIQAEALARSQLEDIKDSPYQDSGVYPVTVDLPHQYSISINVETIDTPTCVEDGNCNTLQKVTVSVYRPTDGGERLILSVKCYKAKK